MKKCTPLLVLFTVFFLLFQVSGAFARELNVVVTFSILEDFVRQVGGDLVTVHSLVPLGIDPHTWEPSPQDARLVARADLLVANGGGFDLWVTKLQKAAASPGTPLVYASQGLTTLGSGHSGDPHFWLSVPNAISYVQQISKALSSLMPEQRAYFETRTAAYRHELEELDQHIEQLLAQIPTEKRILISYHNAFSYLADRYGFQPVEFLVSNPEAEPSPRDLGRLVEILRLQTKPAIFKEPQLSSGDGYIRTLATETQADIYVLYSDGLTAEISSYVEMMKYNARTLFEALMP